MNIKGVLTEKFEEIQNGSFRKREFVLEYAENPQYPELIKFELIQDKCDSLDKFNIGQEMDVHFNLKGRKWVNPKGESVYFNSMQAWKIEGGVAQLGTVSEPPKGAQPTTGNEDDTLPF